MRAAALLLKARDSRVLARHQWATIAAMDCDVEAEACAEYSLPEEAENDKAKAKGRGRPKGTAKADGAGAAAKGKAKAKAKEKKAVIQKDGKPAAKQGGKGKCFCMGCHKNFKAAAMATNKYCVDDKLISDRLYHAAAAQGKSEWIREQLAIPKSCKKLCDAYRERFPNLKERNQPGKFLTTYIEEVNAESGIVFDDDGIMMTKDRYIIEAAKPEFGGVGATAAAAEWDVHFRAPGAITDQKRNKDRVRISMDDHAIFRNKFSSTKRLQKAEKRHQGCNGRAVG